MGGSGALRAAIAACSTCWHGVEAVGCAGWHFAIVCRSRWGAPGDQGALDCQGMLCGVIRVHMVAFCRSGRVLGVG